MARTHTTREQIAFYLLLAALAALALWLVHSYLGAIIFSLAAVIILKPVYDRLLELVGGRSWLAVTLALLICLILLIIPLIFATLVVLGQLRELVTPLQEQGSVAQIVERVNRVVEEITGGRYDLGPEIATQIGQSVVGIATWAAAEALNIATTLPDLFTRLLVFLGIVGTLLPSYERAIARLKRLSPLEDEVDTLFLHKIKLMVWSMFIGIFVIAVVQGLVTGMFLWLAGVSYVPLWTLLAVVASVFPLGASLIAIPIGIFLLVTGKYAGALIVLGGYLLVVSNLDSLIRPRLVAKDAYLNFALLLLSAVGGLELFGFFGVVYGPVLMILFLTAIDVYETYYATPAAPKMIADESTAAAHESPVLTPQPHESSPAGRAHDSRTTESSHRDA
jgi:predicted PurR-regulated permease PerM